MAKSDWLDKVKAEAEKRFYADSNRFTSEAKVEKPKAKKVAKKASDKK